MTDWAKKRKRPYTEIGIQRLNCARCGCQAHAQWNVCADGSYRAICFACDVALNRLVLEWFGHPDVGSVITEYEERSV